MNELIRQIILLAVNKYLASLRDEESVQSGRYRDARKQLDLFTEWLYFYLRGEK